MRTIPLIVILLLLLAFAPVLSRAQSNKGTEFWTCWMDHVDGTGSNMSLYITGDANTTGTVDLSDGSASKPFNVTANQVTVVNIPTSVFLATGGKFAKGIHITSQKNIVVYAHIYANARSGATLVLPVNTLGKDYYSINYTQKPTTAYSAFCVVGTEDNTTIEITPTAKLTTGEVANSKFTVTLQKGEVYQGLSGTDLTGTHVRSISSGTEACKKIAVYSGSSWIAIGCSTKTSADNLYQQVYPTASWGKNYVTAPLSGRNYDVFRIIYSDPTAKVQVNGTTIAASQLVNNLYYEFNSNTTNSITSDKPIQVVQYAVTQGSNMNCTVNNEAVGDPEMIFLSPIEQGLDHVTLYSANKQNIVQSYINVIIPTGAAPSFKLDGNAYSGFKLVPQNTAYSYAQINVASGATHNISASVPFNAIAYGFGDVESYGYAAGTDLKNLNEFIVLTDPVTNTSASSGCVNVTYKPQVSIPYQTSKITWDLKDGSAPLVVTPTAPDNTVTKNGQTLYVYNYPSTVTYTTPGDRTIVATVFNATADECGSNEDIEFDYTISDAPAPAFTADKTSACPDDVITFTDKTQTNGVNTKSWQWDFGDGTAGDAANTIQNPKHTYAAPGDHKVTLTVVNDNGCSTTSAPQTIHINKVPVASFTVSPIDCETKDVSFDATASLPGEGTFRSLVWDFGDATTPVTKTTNTAITHQFATAGTYTVTLTITSSTGCTAVLSKQVIVHSLPVLDFTLPDACLNDSPQFISKSTIADHTESEFTYLWNFGDPNAAPANNTSQLASPTHHYTEERDDTNPYIITLTVTSKYGCAVTYTQKFTVNGSSPTANFSIPASPYCSSDVIQLINQAHADFGKITLIKVYWDYDQDQSNYTIYTKDQVNTAGFQPSHQYPLLTIAGATKNYGIKMIAYSGSAASCSAESAVKTVTIKANPAIALGNVGPLCQEFPPVQISENKNGFIGTGTFSGPGVSATGLFDPSKSGAGTFTINYTFHATNGCDYTTTLPVTVYPTPKANAGPDQHILQGGTVSLAASASGTTPLKYKWTLTNGNKATGLDHDDILQPIASPPDDIDYMLTVTSANNCSASAVVHVSVLKAPVVPNTFTPNNDGVNDRWEIKYLDTYPNCTVDVYNRSGEKLYSSVGYPIPWDGTYKGSTLPVGTYYYIINPKNGRKVISGSITIIR